MKAPDCMDIYEDAEFYDQEFANRGREIPFFLKQAKLAGGPVLEVACGTGRITLPIAQASIKITGLDISRPMLERARHNAEVERLAVTWLEQDCRRINADRAFALIFSATNAMQHLHDFDSVNAFLTSAKNALRHIRINGPDSAFLAPKNFCNRREIEVAPIIVEECTVRMVSLWRVRGFQVFLKQRSILRSQ